MIRWLTGCSGFYNRHWKGIFYPENLAQKDWLQFYCEHFKTLELNNTFNNFPKEKSLKDWYDKTPADFLFSVKAPRLVTHFKKFKGCETQMDDLYKACTTGLKDELACILFQMPPTFRYTEENLSLVLANLSNKYKNVIEFRHTSWWIKDVYNILKERNITFCSVDHPAMPGTIVTNTNTAYIRLHGSPAMFYSEYSLEQLQKLHADLRKNRKITEAFIYFNNTGDAGIKNALIFESLQK